MLQLASSTPTDFWLESSREWKLDHEAEEQLAGVGLLGELSWPRDAPTLEFAPSCRILNTSRSRSIAVKKVTIYTSYYHHSSVSRRDGCTAHDSCVCCVA